MYDPDTKQSLLGGDGRTAANATASSRRRAIPPTGYAAQAAALSPRTAAHVNGRAKTADLMSMPSGPEGLPDAEIKSGGNEQKQIVQKDLDLARTMGFLGLGLMNSPDFANTEANRNNLLAVTPTHIAKARSVLNTTMSGMSSAVPIQVESDIPRIATIQGVEPAGYVYRFTFNPDVHLTPLYFDHSPEQRASILIHEATHAYAGTEDHGYSNEGHYRSLAPELRLDNADSYAEFCRDAYAGRVATIRDHNQAELERYAEDHADAIYAAFELGEAKPYHPYVLDGHEIAGTVVQEIVCRIWGERHPTWLAELKEAMTTGDYDGYDDFTCSDGTVLDRSFVSNLADHYHLWMM